MRWSCVWRTSNVSWAHIHTFNSRKRRIHTGIHILTEHDGWTAPAYLTEALLLTITSYKHISTFKENHKMIFLRSGAFKVPVAKLTTSKSNLLWAAITRVVRSTESVQSQAGYDIPFKPLKPAHQETKWAAAAPLQFHSGPHYTSRSGTQSLAEIRGREHWSGPEFVIRCQRASRCGAEFAVEPHLIRLPGQCFSSGKLQRQASLIFIITSLLLHAGSDLRSHKLTSHRLISGLYRHLRCQTRTPLSCF